MRGAVLQFELCDDQNAVDNVDYINVSVDPCGSTVHIRSRAEKAWQLCCEHAREHETTLAEIVLNFPWFSDIPESMPAAEVQGVFCTLLDAFARRTREIPLVLSLFWTQQQYGDFGFLRKMPPSVRCLELGGPPPLVVPALDLPGTDVSVNVLQNPKT